MKQRLGAGCLITVLGAHAQRRQSLVRSLHHGLATQGLPAQRLPFCAPPPSRPTDAWLASQQRALQQALDVGTVLSEGHTALLCAEMGALAPDTLHAAAQTQLARSALVLLCATGAKDVPPAQTLDTRLRGLLLTARVPFSVLHGEGEAALALAWQALCMAVGGALPLASAEAAPANRSWRADCDACSDSDCEHRLFSELLARRGTT